MAGIQHLQKQLLRQKRCLLAMGIYGERRNEFDGGDYNYDFDNDGVSLLVLQVLQPPANLRCPPAPSAAHFPRPSRRRCAV